MARGCPVRLSSSCSFSLSSSATSSTCSSARMAAISFASLLSSACSQSEMSWQLWHQISLSESLANLLPEHPWWLPAIHTVTSQTWDMHTR